MAESWGMKEEARRRLQHCSRREGQVAWSRAARREVPTERRSVQRPNGQVAWSRAARREVPTEWRSVQRPNAEFSDKLGSQNKGKE